MNCKPGDMAIVVGSDFSDFANLGRIVEVVEATNEFGPGFWHVKMTGSKGSARNPDTGKKGRRQHGAIHDRNLRPISGLPLEDEVEREEPVIA